VSITAPIHVFIESDGVVVIFSDAQHHDQEV